MSGRRSPRVGALTGPSNSLRARPLFVLLAVAVTAGAIVAGGRLFGGEDAGPARLTLAELAFGQEDYSGRRVRTEGLVQRFGPEDGALRLHYVISDEADNRVRLVGGDPARYVGRTVEVVGRFELTETSGRTITVEEVRPR